MASGAIRKFNHRGVLGLLNYFLGDWRTFEGWCVAQGCNPLTENPRRMINLMVFFLEKDMDPKVREELRSNLERTYYDPPKRSFSKKVESKDKPSAVVIDKKTRWKAPPGWKPPGWNEEKSYAAAMSFMGFNANPK